MSQENVKDILFAAGFLPEGGDRGRDREGEREGERKGEREITGLLKRRSIIPIGFP